MLVPVFRRLGTQCVQFALRRLRQLSPVSLADVVQLLTGLAVGLRPRVEKEAELDPGLGLIILAAACGKPTPGFFGRA